ncbi:MAG: hypothetical protein WBM83_04505 [Flavobacteriaceae bacterium]
MKYTLLILLAIITSCNGHKKVTDKKANDLKANVKNPLSLVIRDNYSGSDVAETLIITNTKALNSFFSKVNRTRKPGLPVPEIDFSKEMVVIYCSGEVTGNLRPELLLLQETDKKIVFGPSSDTVVKKTNMTASISPFCVYKMPLTDKEIIFELKK